MTGKKGKKARKERKKENKRTKRRKDAQIHRRSFRGYNKPKKRRHKYLEGKIRGKKRRKGETTSVKENKLP